MLRGMLNAAIEVSFRINSCGCRSCGEEDVATSGAAYCILKIEARSQPRFSQIAAFDRVLRLRTGTAFTSVLIRHGIAISMDGKGAWRDNVFVERLWRSIKY